MCVVSCVSVNYPNIFLNEIFKFEETFLCNIYSFPCTEIEYNKLISLSYGFPSRSRTVLSSLYKDL